VHSYGQFCPTSRGAEVFATRWTPLIVRNLLLGCRTFGEIRGGLPGISKSLLSQRLDLLRHYGVVERRPNPHGRGWLYELTPAGRDLRPVCDALAVWGARWIELAPEHFDPGITLWALCRTLPEERMPAERFVLQVATDAPRRRWWLLVERPRAELCVMPPGFDEDVRLRTTPEWLVRWHVGELSLGQAMARGLIEVEGRRDDVRMLAGWGGLGRVASPAP
jgi:DNA-binding HxlR family transcriptional regulator